MFHRKSSRLVWYVVLHAPGGGSGSCEAEDCLLAYARIELLINKNGRVRIRLTHLSALQNLPEKRLASMLLIASLVSVCQRLDELESVTDWPVGTSIEWTVSCWPMNVPARKAYGEHIGATGPPLEFGGADRYPLTDALTKPRWNGTSPEFIPLLNFSLPPPSSSYPPSSPSQPRRRSSIPALHPDDDVGHTPSPPQLSSTDETRHTGGFSWAI